MDITLPDSGQTLRPGKLICVGKNYARHAAEMGGSVPSEPMLFLKPSTALVGHGGSVVLPPHSTDVHHEVELVAVIGRGGKNIAVDNALDYVDGYAVGLDMTARDLQQKAKEAGAPWSVAKGFDTFAPIGAFVTAREVGDPGRLDIELKVNGDVKQRGSTQDMVFSVAEIISYSSRIFTLMPGDLIFTGTPEGVGPVADGDVLEASATSLPDLRVRVRRG